MLKYFEFDFEIIQTHVTIVDSFTYLTEDRTKDFFQQISAMEGGCWNFNIFFIKNFGIDCIFVVAT